MCVFIYSYTHTLDRGSAQAPTSPIYNTLPYSYPHNSGPIQWVPGNFALKRSVAARPRPLPGDTAPLGAISIVPFKSARYYHLK